jgi:hypothetical protein
MHNQIPKSNETNSLPVRKVSERHGNASKRAMNFTKKGKGIFRMPGSYTWRHIIITL